MESRATTHLVGRESLVCQQGGGPRDDDLQHVVDHRREILPHEVRLGVDQAQQQRKPPAQPPQRLGHLLANLTLLGQLPLEQLSILLAQRSHHGLFPRQRFPELRLPHFNLALLAALLRDGRLGLGSGEHIDEGHPFWSGPYAILGWTNEGEVREGEVVLELGEQEGYDRRGEDEGERRGGAVGGLGKERAL